MNTLVPRSSRTTVATGAVASRHDATAPNNITRRQRVERDIHATLGRIERLACAGQNPGFPVDFERRLQRAARPLAAPRQYLTMRNLVTTHRDLSRLADEATVVKMLEGAA